MPRDSTHRRFPLAPAATRAWGAFLCLLGALAPGAGCGGDDAVSPEGLPLSPGVAVFVPAVTSFELDSTGGGLAVPPPSGACDPQIYSYGVTLETGTLAWSRCTIGTDATGPTYTPSSGSRVLAPSELASVKAAFGAVRVSPQTSCGADKEARTLQVSTARGSLIYGDDFYACLGKYRAYVETGGLDQLLSVVSPLARPEVPPGNAPLATAPGASVLVDSVVEMKVESLGGGLAGPPQPDVQCDGQVWSYDVSLAQSTLAWQRCSTSSGVATPSTGTRVLVSSELDAVKAALAQVTISTSTSCGADKPIWQLTVSSAMASLTYGDDFYACLAASTPYVSGLDGLVQVLQPLAVLQPL